MKVNNALWKFLFQSYRIISDHSAFVIVTVCVMWSLIITFFVQKVLKKKKMAAGLLDIIPVTSVYFMLRQLPLIHPRLKLMLSTVSEIIVGSDTYKEAFLQQTGVAAKNASTVVYTLYYTPYKTLISWENAEPKMLYEKLGSVFHDTRYLFGYLDFKVSGIYMLILICIALYFIYDFSKKKKKRESLFHIISCILLGFSKNGCVLAYLTILLTEHFIIQNLFEKSGT